MERVRIKNRVRKSLRFSIFDGIAASITNGIVDNYIRPMALAFNATDIQIGVLSSVPHLLSSLAQLKAPELTELVGSRKGLIQRAVFFHALALAAIASLPLLLDGHGLLSVATDGHGMMMLTLLYCLCLVFGSLGQPAWGSMMAELVPRRRLGIYFGRRERIMGLVAVSSCFMAGLFLHWQTSQILMAFSVVFFAAALSRLASYYYMGKMYEPPMKEGREHYFSFTDFLKRMPRGNFGRYIFFLGSMNLAVNISAPFFSVFMLRELGFSYITFTLLTTIGALAQLLAKPFWGRYADRVGNLRVLRITSSVVPVLPILWVFSQDVYYLLFVQVAAGIAWGGFNLCSVNFIYQSVIPEKRTRCISYSNSITGVATFVGMLLAGFLATHLPPIMGHRILTLFLLSGILRACFGLLLLSKVKETKAQERIPSLSPPKADFLPDVLAEGERIAA